MFIKIFIIVLCVPLYVVNSFCDKYASTYDENKHNVMYNWIKFLVCSVILLPVCFFDTMPKLKLGAIVCGVLCGIMYAVSKTIILKGYEKTSVAFMTLCHASGMIVPCIVGNFFWNEKLTPWSVIGILIVVFSIVLIKGGNSDKKSMDFKGVLIGVVVFITSGGVMIAQKLMGLYFADESVIAYNLYSFVVTFAILCFFAKPKQAGKKAIKKISLPAVGSAVSLCIISLVMTKLAGGIPSVILFPLFNGLGIIFVCISSAYVFKEKMTVKKFIGLIAGVCGLCLVNL